MKKILLSHALYKDGMNALEGKADVIVTDNGNADEILEQLKNVDGFILRIGHIGRKVIEECKNLKVITRPGVGVDNVDVEAATEAGIPVVICPAANSRAVAEHTLALMFAVAKNIVDSDVETRKGNFNIRNKYAAVELKNRTVSLLGFGNIGKILAEMCSGLGMDIVVYDPYIDKKAVTGLGYKYAEKMEDALKLGDFISLHMPSTPETEGMISEDQFAQMKETAFFINCARGTVVNEAAMISALEKGIIAGAGLDVLEVEPMSKDNPIMSLSNVVITPHMAAQTQETTSKTVLMAVEGTLAILNGEKWPHVCNPEVYDHPIWK